MEALLENPPKGEIADTPAHGGSKKAEGERLRRVEWTHGEGSIKESGRKVMTLACQFWNPELVVSHNWLNLRPSLNEMERQSNRA